MKRVVVLLMMLVIGIEGFGQCTPATMRIRLVVTDAGLGRDSLWFGFDATASYGLDPDLCEWELPPHGPPGQIYFDARFVNIPGRDGLDTPAGLGNGFLEDYRAFHSGYGIDTFKIAFQPSDAGYPITFSWDINNILAVCDSAILQDEFGGVIIKARMHAVSSLVVLNSIFTRLILMLYFRPSDVELSGDEIPGEFSLLQNYPNPVNPSTRIEYKVPRQTHVRLSVANVLGEEIAILVDGERSPGRYAADFDATPYASGVYFYRMVAGNVVYTRKMVVTK